MQPSITTTDTKEFKMARRRTPFVITMMTAGTLAAGLSGCPMTSTNPPLDDTGESCDDTGLGSDDTGDDTGGCDDTGNELPLNG